MDLSKNEVKDLLNQPKSILKLNNVSSSQQGSFSQNNSKPSYLSVIKEPEIPCMFKLRARRLAGDKVHFSSQVIEAFEREKQGNA